ncbi:hypothetical protein K435DRAFT_844820 [Dendrothele bispora CBS 962.96]|uniref:Uncharacterized protein n=1 Tax=Dendrothele bispora (strain CBS 962.96) TaxID=1314807 RepID=A0A4S8KZX1_DENBC|nr:hypothetical protein K435DRAFT_844820 [Dendrothele bispora CBS 962.96]
MSSTANVNRATYEIICLLHQHFQPYFVRDSGQLKQISKTVLPFFLDQVASAVQYLNNIVKPDTTLPAIVIVLHRECLQMLLLSFALNQFPMPQWCPGWDVVDGLKRFRCSWDPADALPSLNFTVAVPPVSQQQNPSPTQPPPYTFLQNPTQPRNPSSLASPADLGLPQMARANQPSPSTPKELQLTLNSSAENKGASQATTQGQRDKVDRLGKYLRGYKNQGCACTGAQEEYRVHKGRVNRKRGIKENDIKVANRHYWEVLGAQDGKGVKGSSYLKVVKGSSYLKVVLGSSYLKVVLGQGQG